MRTGACSSFSSAAFDSESSRRISGQPSSESVGWFTVCEPKLTPERCSWRTSDQVRQSRPLNDARVCRDERRRQEHGGGEAELLHRGPGVGQDLAEAIVERQDDAALVVGVPTTAGAVIASMRSMTR